MDYEDGLELDKQQFFDVFDDFELDPLGDEFDELAQMDDPEWLFGDFGSTAAKEEQLPATELSENTKCSDSSLTDENSGTIKEEKSAESPPLERKRKLTDEQAVSTQPKYVEHLEKRLTLLAQENKELRQQLALVKQNNRALRTQIQSIAIPQQPYILAFAHNIQGALTVNSSPRSKTSTGVTLCVFFLLGAFFLPGLFNGDMDNRDLGMLGADSNLALPSGSTHMDPARSGMVTEMQHYGRSLLALPMSEKEQQRRDAVFMCPKVVSVLRDLSSPLDVVSIIVPTDAVRSDESATPKGSFTELVCAVQKVNDLASLSVQSTPRVVGGDNGMVITTVDSPPSPPTLNTSNNNRVHLQAASQQVLISG